MTNHAFRAIALGLNAFLLAYGVVQLIRAVVAVGVAHLPSVASNWAFAQLAAQALAVAALALLPSKPSPKSGNS